MQKTQSKLMALKEIIFSYKLCDKPIKNFTNDLCYTSHPNLNSLNDGWLILIPVKKGYQYIDWYPFILFILMVPEVGIEPTRGCPRRILNPVRLPISPLRHTYFTMTYRFFEIVSKGDTITFTITYSNQKEIRRANTWVRIIAK